MSPRALRYLRVDDDPPKRGHDLARRLRVDIEDLGRWYKFCADIAAQKLWEFELLTIDFNFIYDTSGPPPLGLFENTEIYSQDFLAEDGLDNLEWSGRLKDIGPNSGLLIGAHLVSHAAFRDLPCGVAVRTNYPGMVIKDMSSAMLATQILLASGVEIPIRDLRETLRIVIEFVEESNKQPLRGLLSAVRRFRHSFLQRAGAMEGPVEHEVRLWMEPSSLWTLLDIFGSARTEIDLDQKLEKFGIEFYGRNGALDCLDVRSVFLDRLLRFRQDSALQPLDHLPLADVKPAGPDQPEAGMIWRFIETLAMRTPSNIAPVLEFFRKSKVGEETRTINAAIERKVHRLVALLFAWLDQYADRWFEAQSRPWDPFEEDEPDSDLPTMTEQVGELLRIIAHTREQGWLMDPEPGQMKGAAFDPKVHWLPLSGRGPRMIAALVREQCNSGSPLNKPLRHNQANSSQLSQRRIAALQRLLDVAVRWGCLESDASRPEAGARCYRLKRIEIPEQRPIKTLQIDLARRLGFSLKREEDPSTQLKRIIQSAPGFETVTVKSFLLGLEDTPLPNHLKWLGWEFMDEFWGPSSPLPLPYDAWPVCLAETRETANTAITLVEWRRQTQRSQEAARRVQSIIMPPDLLLGTGRCSIWCHRRPAEDVGGDYYSVKHNTDGTYSIYLGDVCGHGLPAALLVQEMHGLITVLHGQGLSPEQLVAELESKLSERISVPDTNEISSSRTRWASLVCAVLDPSSNNMRFVNAGHPPPILVKKSGEIQRLNPQSRPVGLLPGDVFRSEQMDLSWGDRIVFFTDGVVDGQEQGIPSALSEDAMVRLIVEHRRSGAKDLGEAIRQKLRAPGALSDDLTLIVISLD